MMLVDCPTCGTRVEAGEPCPACGTLTPPPRSTPAGGAPPEPHDPGSTGYRSQWELIQKKLAQVAAPRYRVQGILGYGGMAGVYLADEPRLGRQVAIKVMAPSLMMDPSLVERFRQEARTIAQLDHPNIVTIYEVDEREGLHYFTMTYVAGRTLAHVLADATERLPIPAVAAILYQVGDALAYAHHRGVVHRDVKPGNVLLDQRGNATVTDFGIAKIADAETGLTRTGMLVGTPAYMSPEQCTSERVTGASDQYSLGAVIYQMLTGRPPFEGATLAVLQAHVTTPPTAIRELRPDCPEVMAAAVERMLLKRPEERWPSISAAVAAAGATSPGLEGPVRDQLSLLTAPPASIEIAPRHGTLREGSDEPVEARIFDARGRLLPGRKVTWISSDPRVASVSEGRLFAIAPGQAWIAANAGDVHASLQVTVVADPVPSVTVRPETLSLEVGGRATLQAVISDWDGTPLEDRVVLWSSNDPDVVHVEPDGTVEALGVGEAVVAATSGGRYATATIAVRAATATAPPVAPVEPSPGATPPPAEPGETPTQTPAPQTPAPQTPAPVGSPTGADSGSANSGSANSGSADSGSADSGSADSGSADSGGTDPGETGAPALPWEEISSPTPPPTPGATPGPTPRPESAPTEARPRPGHRRTVVGIGALLAVAVVTLLVLRPWRSGGPEPMREPTPSSTSGSSGARAGNAGAGTTPVPSEATASAPTGDAQRQPPDTGAPDAETAGGTPEAGASAASPTPARPEPRRADEGGTRSEANEGGGQESAGTPAAAGGAAPDEEEPPPAPRKGTVRIGGGSLPASASISVRQPDGTTRSVSGRSVDLAPGSYTFRFEAPGYYPDQGVVVVRPGATASWTPSLQAEPTQEPEPEAPPEAPREAPPETPPSTPPATGGAEADTDTEADLAAIDAVVRRWVQAFDDRDAATVVPLLPADTRTQWRALLTDRRAVTDFSATVDSVSAPAVSGDRGTVGFSMTIAFRSGNAPQRQTLAYEAVARREGDAWTLVSMTAR